METLSPKQPTFWFGLWGIEGRAGPSRRVPWLAYWLNLSKKRPGCCSAEISLARPNLYYKMELLILASLITKRMLLEHGVFVPGPGLVTLFVWEWNRAIEVEVFRNWNNPQCFGAKRPNSTEPVETQPCSAVSAIGAITFFQNHYVRAKKSASWHKRR